MKSVGEPDAGNPHVRFDERGGENGTMPHGPKSPRLSSTLLEYFRRPNLNHRTRLLGLAKRSTQPTAPHAALSLERALRNTQ